jgi:hypothetical protein
MTFDVIMVAVNEAVYDSNIQTLDKFMTYVEERIDDSDSFNALKELLDEFKKTIKEKVKVKNVKKGEKGKRTPTAYNIFMSEMMKKIKTENPNMSSKDIMAKTTSEWKQMSMEEKTAYKESKRRNTEVDTNKIEKVENLPSEEEDVKPKQKSKGKKK